jgi:phenylpropionate dioxygenase-like ring-hydroxylating dioxygenase large terminal subunit
MFTSTQHLPQRLTPAHYTSPEVYQRELESIFYPAWHCIGTLVDAPKLGDYFTCELFGTPLVCWHTSQGFQAFLNVCTHRFCTLTDKRKGHFAERIKCQYHGWEYDETGNTCKIPDAQHFRPLKKGELGLREYRTESIGQLIFVNLSDNPVGVREHLGPELTAWCERYFTPQHRLTQYNQMDLACNWKIVVENVLEAYHIACVHPKSFKTYPTADRVFHEFHPTWDYYKHDTSDIKAGCRWENLFARIAGREPEYNWEHILRYPNFVLGGSGPWHYVQTIVPTGPQTCRSTWYNMHNAGPRGRFLNFLLHRLLYRLGKRIADRVQGEDAVIYPSVHRGTAAAHRPHGGGLISAREERIFTFQDYVLKSLSNDTPQEVVPLPPPPEGIDAAIFRQPRTPVVSAN